MNRKKKLEEIIDYFFQQNRKYFSFKEVKESVFKKDSFYELETLKKNLYRFKKEMKIFSAGRGWYSIISTPFILDKKPVRNIINYIKKEFPLLAFNCWSIQQIQSYYHHIPIKFIIFVYMKKDYLKTIYDFLHERYKNVYNNPLQLELEKIFSIENQTIVLRPSISEEPVKGNYAQVEKILVDLFVEKGKLDLLDEWEYNEIFQKIITQYRINIPKIIRYCKRRMLNNCPLMAIIDKYCQ